MAKTISKDLKAIATRYAINDEKQIEEILIAMPVTNTDKPSEEQIKGFEKVCALIQDGKQMSEAIKAASLETKNGKSERAPQTNDSAAPSKSPHTELSQVKLDEFILAQGDRAADMTLASLPNIAIEEHDRLKALFRQRYQQRIMERLQDPEYRQQFEAVIEGQDMGKLSLLNNTTSNFALPSSSSSNS